MSGGGGGSGGDKRRDLRERIREVNEDHDSKPMGSRGPRDKRSFRDSDSAHQRLNDQLKEHQNRSNAD